MSRQVAALDLERIQLLDHIESMRNKMKLTFKAHLLNWATFIQQDQAESGLQGRKEVGMKERRA